MLTADEVLNEDGTPGVVIRLQCTILKISLIIGSVRANMNLQLGVNSLYTKRGFK